MLSCATAPNMKTTVEMPPTMTSEMPVMRSSISFGRAMVRMLNTSPADIATRMNMPNTAAATQGARRTSGVALRVEACCRSSGMTNR